jgi:hypothetical protein
MDFLNCLQVVGASVADLVITLCSLSRNIMLCICVFRISITSERPCALTIVCGARDEPRERIYVYIYIYMYIYIYGGVQKTRAKTRTC